MSGSRSPSRLRLTPRGPFSLAEAAGFADSFPGTEASVGAGALRFAWAVDGDWRTVTATLRQPSTAVVAELRGADTETLRRRARRDLERILSLDVDGAGFLEVGRRDPVVGALQRRFEGLRPVLFYTPYEAAAWTIIGHRIQRRQAEAIKNRLAHELGVDGAFPAPDRLVELDEASPPRGLTGQKVQRLRAIARAAADGLLTREHLRSLGREQALAQLQELPGIGPFSAELIQIRGSGDPDAFPHNEPRVVAALRAVYGLADDAPLDATAEAWRPYRAWVSLLLRVDAARPA